MLGKQQFEIVAKGSKEFDRYLKALLQGGDDEIARRDQWRDDQYHDAETPQMSLSKPTPKISSSRAEFPVVTESESEGSDDSETKDDDDEDDEDIDVKTTAKDKSNPDAEVNVEAKGVTSTDFEDFMRFKAFMEKDKKK